MRHRGWLVLDDAIRLNATLVVRTICYISSGIGAGGIFLTGPTIVQQKFTTNRGLATGAATLGLSLGSLVHPAVTKYLLNQFGLRGTLLIQGAICYHGALLCFAFKSPRKYKEQIGQKKDLKKSITTVPSVSERVDHLPSTDKGHTNHDIDIHNGIVDKCHGSNTNTSFQNTYTTKTATKQAKYHLWKDYFRKMLDFSPMKNVCFVICVVHYLLAWMSKFGILTHMVTCAKLRGIPAEDAAYLMSIIGLGNLVARIISPFLMNIPRMDPVWVLFVSAVFVAASAFGTAFAHTYNGLTVCAVMLGFGDGKQIL